MTYDFEPLSEEVLQRIGGKFTYVPTMRETAGMARELLALRAAVRALVEILERLHLAQDRDDWEAAKEIEEEITSTLRELNAHITRSAS